jgi:hypothetical protein
MIKYQLALIVFMVFLSSCDSELEPDRNHEKSFIRGALQSRVAKKVQKKHKIYASGFGFWGPDCYEELDISFDYPDRLSRDDARFLILDIAAIFLEEVNQDEKIRPHLCQYPYTVKNLSIPIFPHKNGYEKPIHPDFVLIDLQGGVISFKTKLENQKYDYHSEEKETVEEALKILNEQGRVPDYFKEV